MVLAVPLGGELGQPEHEWGKLEGHHASDDAPRDETLAAKVGMPTPHVDAFVLIVHAHKGGFKVHPHELVGPSSAAVHILGGPSPSHVERMSRERVIGHVMGFARIEFGGKEVSIGVLSRDKRELVIEKSSERHFPLIHGRTLAGSMGVEYV